VKTAARLVPVLRKPDFSLSIQLVRAAGGGITAAAGISGCCAADVSPPVMHDLHRGQLRSATVADFFLEKTKHVEFRGITAFYGTAPLVFSRTALLHGRDLAKPSPPAAGAGAGTSGRCRANVLKPGGGVAEGGTTMHWLI
jgi:hypothetical protein